VRGVGIVYPRLHRGLLAFCPDGAVRWRQVCELNNPPCHWLYDCGATKSVLIMTLLILLSTKIVGVTRLFI
jgi:hypothetical protein